MRERSAHGSCGSLGSVVGLAIEGAAFFLHEPADTGLAAPHAVDAITARVEVFTDDPDGLVRRTLRGRVAVAVDVIEERLEP